MCGAAALNPSIHIVHIGHGVVWALPYMRWYTTSERPGALNNSLMRTRRTGPSPSSRRSGPSSKT